MPKTLNLMVACSENRVIGVKGRLPWRIAEDLAFFHAETANKVIILGRICYQTWPRAREDGHKLIVITRDKGLADDLVQVASSVQEAIEIAERTPGEVCVNGGERIYEEVLAMERPMRLYLTLVHAHVEGDTFFPEWRHISWREVAKRESSDANYRYTFYTLDRILK
jgi:dihydrofolate reductase